ncbi:MAG: CRISPR system precrRNA processing endoribonuclease RAMP protein Cas6 [Bacteroidales bacterium]|nr:CRISPR system precrRNA processing endoribonuclease RAMP protein Cas6 [Bacteroidales bacterium]
MDWNKITFAKLEFVLQFKESLQAPEFWGNTLRGGLGTMLFENNCLYDEPNCSHCYYKDCCLYACLFRSTRSRRLKASKVMQYYPAPFTLDPLSDDKPCFFKGEPLCFNLILLGEAVNYIQYFIFAFKQLGMKGLGRKEQKFELLKVTAFDDPAVIFYQRNSKMVQAGHSFSTFAEFLAKNKQNNIFDGKMNLQFLTRTRFQKEYNNAENPSDFEVLVDHILERLMLLSELYCDYTPQIDRSQLVAVARPVQTIAEELIWEDVDLKSKSEKRKYWYGGFKGKITFTNVPEILIPYLRFGELFHVGHGTTRGYGNYKITIM